MELKKIKNNVLELLENTKFPKCYSRKNIISTRITRSADIKKSIEAFVLGEVNYRGQKSLNYRTRGPSRYNKKFPLLYSEIKKLMNKYDPSFEYTTIQVNKNVLSPPHVDKNNVGPSYIIALGDFEGGKLVIEGKEHNIKNRFYNFDGRLGHWVTPFKGTRYSLVFFTHTFKPPSASLKNIKVTKRGLYKGETLLKKYKSLK